MKTYSALPSEKFKTSKEKTADLGHDTWCQRGLRKMYLFCAFCRDLGNVLLHGSAASDATCPAGLALNPGLF